MKSNGNSLILSLLTDRLSQRSAVSTLFFKSGKFVICLTDNSVIEAEVQEDQFDEEQIKFVGKEVEKAPFEERVVEIQINRAGVYLLTESGELYSKGIDIYKNGILGLGANFIISNFQKISLSEKVKSFAVSDRNCIVLSG